VSSLACFSARTASAVSRTLPQLFSDILLCSSVTQSSKMLSGVARIVRAISWVVRVSQFVAFSSRHWNPSSVFDCGCWDVVVSVSLAAMVRVIENRIIIRSALVFFMG